jgi:thiamine-monophosphate kinase
VSLAAGSEEPGRVVADVAERALIARVRARLGAAPPAWLTIGIGDDAAVVEPPRNALEVITTDVAVEGIHFDRRFAPTDAIGARALAMSLSDLAAMGAAPRLATLSLLLPAELTLEEFDGIIEGVAAMARAHRVTVVGGNLARSPGPLAIDVTAVGTVGRRRVLTRSGARPGDHVYVSGTLGGAQAGLEQLQAGAAGDEAPSAARYLRPQPRVRLGTLLGRARAASACMDLSDGLGDALDQVAEASAVAIDVDTAALPVEDATRAWFARTGVDLVAAIAGSDDYELLFTVPPRTAGRLRHVTALVKDVPVTRIGTVAAGTGVRLRRDDRFDALPAGYSHFGPPRG